MSGSIDTGFPRRRLHFRLNAAALTVCGQTLDQSWTTIVDRLPRVDCLLCRAWLEKRGLVAKAAARASGVSPAKGG